MTADRPSCVNLGWTRAWARSTRACGPGLSLLAGPDQVAGVDRWRETVVEFGSKRLSHFDPDAEALLLHQRNPTGWAGLHSAGSTFDDALVLVDASVPTAGLSLLPRPEEKSPGSSCGGNPRLSRTGSRHAPHVDAEPSLIVSGTHGMGLDSVRPRPMFDDPLVLLDPMGSTVVPHHQDRYPRPPALSPLVRCAHDGSNRAVLVDGVHRNTAFAGRVDVVADEINSRKGDLGHTGVRATWCQVDR